ncbi:hypothetical protein RHGRI_030366 [Rhododendron griersonianum]|uniref:non-specific serine/threonine protein kinase n=1 Tax=Rhododendron griersonianum TaxID=479676 RepID=A0AAV6IMV0_9ERIC|nr:hypothetical protein RHGRI_030366 [Rhododendron griersonianum]
MQTVQVRGGVHSPTWTRPENKVFEHVLVVFPDETADRWRRIADQLSGVVAGGEEVRAHFEDLVDDVFEIDSGRVELTSYSDDSDIGSGWEGGKPVASQISFGAAGEWRKRCEFDRKKGTPWTEENTVKDWIIFNARTVTPKRKKIQRPGKSNGRTSSGVGSDEKLDQGVDESVDGCTIGKLFVSNREIAMGSNGTIVLEGTYEGRPVAVKRLVKAYHDVASKEHRNLRVTDSHPNIVRLYGKESDRDFVYLALERCTCNLNDFIQKPTVSEDQASDGTLPEVKLWTDSGYPSPILLKLMRDMVSGLVHLHKLGMIHRDLKPQNVLILLKEGSLCAKLSDMGISKRLVGDKSSLGNHATGKYS